VRHSARKWAVQQHGPLHGNAADRLALPTQHRDELIHKINEIMMLCELSPLPGLVWLVPEAIHMNADDLIAEGERLSRPCLLLSERKDSGPYSAIWGGKSILKPAPGPLQHWITIDCDWLARQGYPLTRLLSVYTKEEDYETGVVVHDRSAKLPTKPRFDLAEYSRKTRFNRIKAGTGGPDAQTSVALYGKESLSFPPIEAVFKYGNRAVKTWLSSLGLPKADQWDPYFQAQKAVEPYDEEFRKRCPLHDYEELRTAAMLGGWHMQWPEGDWLELTKKRFVLWTFWNSEPWVEVWLNESGNFEVKLRIT
jgi:hypothetical protein